MRKLILKNSFFSVTQMLLKMAFLFILYRIIYRELGVEELGLWSLTYAFLSFLDYASLGIPGGIVKFVAQYAARKKYTECSELVQTSIMMMFGLSCMALLIGYPIVRLLLLQLVDSDTTLLLELLNLGAIAFILQMIYNSYVSVYDGFNQIYRRNIVSMVGETIHFILSIVFIFRFGIIGVVYAKIIEHLIILIGAVFVIPTFFKEMPYIPRVFKAKYLREILGYSLHFKVAGLMASLVNPLLRALINHYGGLGLVGYYEMAQKLVHKFSRLVAVALQSLFPTIAALKETDPDKMYTVYTMVFRVILSAVYPAMLLFGFAAPFISLVWLGEMSIIFSALVVVLSITYGSEIIKFPARLCMFGLGELKWIQITNGITLALVTFLGSVGGVFFDGVGVVAGTSIALFISFNLLTVVFHRIHHIPLFSLISLKTKLVYLFLGILYILLVHLYRGSFGDYFLTLYGGIGTTALILVVAGAHKDMRMLIQGKKA
ncbi:oligosaccharide flippase family protein [Chitinivibrio alkaliphilus]|uniref:MATE-like superfamily protein n=1 Tax=Chitinivibrio alkaliphilus ACht1 TaxID=1313304 RepID=U7DAI2_9BACT|nr:oligosaccharide flippase family protein [Chitinivibrio alkaliphilus]ERP31400.1 MATE-like superfamily protein [Chitinivibrio alkaliphilus ACht1]